MLRSAVIAAALAMVGCHGASAKSPAAASAGSTPAATCDRLAGDLVAFGEVLETASANAKLRVVTYAGLLELLLSFESASKELDVELASLGETAGMEKTRASLARSIQFARSEREALEKHAKEIAPLARETQQAWVALRAACEGPRRAPECSGVRDAIGKYDGADTSEAHEKAVAALGALKITTPALVKARDRATKASKAASVAIAARRETTNAMPQRWAEVQKDLASSVDGLVASCKGEPHPSSQLVAAAKPDPRKLTVLVHVRPPAGVERQLLALSASARDPGEKAFYRARAEGAFGSGFFLVQKGAKNKPEVLVVTNRHVVELGDVAALELADGTSLGQAEIVYANPAHDLAVLRPTGKLTVKEGFAFADQPVKDQQTVIATGFPGMIGRPSYQTTKGYVSNESFRLDEGMRPLTYVQHTAPIDPGSSGGPLTDEAGHIVGVNTLKVSGRENVGLAVPSKYVLSTLQVASSIEAHHAKGARLACLGFVAELGAAEPRMLVLEQMISNHLVAGDGLEAAAALSSEPGFEELWNDDSVRAMRIATLVKLRTLIMGGGGPSVLETCDDADTKADTAKYRIRMGNFETRELLLRWEHGRWKIDGLDAKGAAAARPGSKKLPAAGPGGSRKVAPPKKRP
ncbi:MAG: trypsin-like peptidase domain-containing protein [Labilithrix sp.]|nr:trypsin-like peptidase domain-containing protein [Labilithrix sp.]MCW5813529.1 trypsin-like peptidase domain-containing protein [Labilithrix sp.]